MEKSCTGRVCPSVVTTCLVLTVIAVLGQVHGQGYGGRRHLPAMALPFQPTTFMQGHGMASPFNGMPLSPLHFAPQWNGLAFNSVNMFNNQWAQQFNYQQQVAEFYRQQNMQAAARNQFRAVQQYPQQVTYNVPTTKLPVIHQYTKAPSVQRVVLPRKQKISVLSGPLVDVRPFPNHQNKRRPSMKKKLAFKPVAKAKPFHRMLAGTALGINKG